MKFKEELLHSVLQKLYEYRIIVIHYQNLNKKKHSFSEIFKFLLLYVFSLSSQDRSVSIAGRPWAGQTRNWGKIPTRGKRFFSAHPESCEVVARCSFLWVKVA
jgi:hypothetical protein